MIILTLFFGLILGYEISNSGILRDLRDYIKRKYES